MKIILPILSIIIVLPISYFVGYKLRPLVPNNKRFSVGFGVGLIVYSLIALVYFAFYEFGRYDNAIGIAVLIGFPLGLGGPPFDHKKS